MPRTSVPFLPYNPAILRWARKLRDYSLEDASKGIKVSASKIGEWEENISIPTVKQARKLASFYKRPFLEFFSHTIPDLPQTQLVPDFRLNAPKIQPGSQNTIKEIQEWAESQRLNAIDLYELNDEALPHFPKSLYASEKDNPEQIAKRARTAIKFTIVQQLSLRGNDRNDLFKILRHCLEETGVLVFKESKLKECNARGLCVFNDPLPIIVVGSESVAGSCFTLAHELGHIILKQSAISGLYVPQTTTQAAAKIERWCDQFASAFLMPEDEIRQIVPHKSMVEEIPDNELNYYARTFSVSAHAMLVRLVQLGLVNQNYYWNVKRPEFLAQESQFKGGGRSTYYGSRYRNHNGDLFTGLVLDAWNSGKITNHNAAEYMGIKNLTHLFDIRKNFNAE